MFKLTNEKNAVHGQWSVMHIYAYPVILLRHDSILSKNTFSQKGHHRFASHKFVNLLLDPLNKYLLIK